MRETNKPKWLVVGVKLLISWWAFLISIMLIGVFVAEVAEAIIGESISGSIAVIFTIISIVCASSTFAVWTYKKPSYRKRT
jgi:hypothetical protein